MLGGGGTSAEFRREEEMLYDHLEPVIDGSMLPLVVFHQELGVLGSSSCQCDFLPIGIGNERKASETLVRIA
jgi:hypothetical protein